MPTKPIQTEFLKGLTEAPSSIVSGLSFVTQSGGKELAYKVEIAKIAEYINSSTVIPVNQVTYSEAATKVSSNTLSAGEIYEITDATQANGGKGSVFLTAINGNIFSNDAIWKITSDFKGFAWIDLGGTMTGGDTVTVVSIDSVNQLSAPVAFATDYDALAIAIAADINANASATYTAFAIQRRVILINKNTGSASNGDTVAATGTNLTLQDTQDVTNGQEDEILYIDINYDFLKNQIYSAYYNFSNVNITTTDRNISDLGHNPIYYFPFGDKNSAYGSSRDTFENSNFNGQTFKDVYYVDSYFNDSNFHSSLTWTVTDGCALRKAVFEKAEYIGGTINLSGSIHTFTGATDYFNLSRCIFYNDSNYDFSNTIIGGKDFSFGREMGDVNLDLSGSTITLAQNSKYVAKTNGSFTMTDTVFNGTLLIQAEDNITIDATGITTTSEIKVDNYLTENINIDLSGATLSGNFNLTGVITDSVMDFSGCTIGGVSIVDSHLRNFDITATQNYGSKTITIQNSNLSDYSWTVPVSVAENIFINKTEWANDVFNFNVDLTLDGSAGSGEGGDSLTVEQSVPDNWFVTSSFSEGNLAGSGNVEVGMTGATTTIIPATAATSLNSIIEQTVIKTKSTDIIRVLGAISGSTPTNDVTGQLKIWVQGKIGI